jgi:hypothetical protein
MMVGGHTRVGMARIFLAGAALLLATACIKISPMIPSWPKAAVPQGALTLAPDSGYIVAAQINGHPVRLRVDPGYSGIVLNPDVAARIGLERSIWENDVMVGPVRMQGETGVAPVTIGTATDTRRITWFDKTITPVADGIINMAHLPYERVTLQLQPERPGEADIALPTLPDGFWSITHHQPVGDRKIEVRFGLDIPRTVMTASTGAKLAELHGGSWAGEVFPHVIGFFVERPVRPMAFARTVTLGGLSFDRALVRGSDWRGRNALPTDPPADPSEIVVTGDKGKTKAVYNALLGRDLLARCSSISYVGASRLLTLRCLPGRAG